MSLTRVPALFRFSAFATVFALLSSATASSVPAAVAFSGELGSLAGLALQGFQAPAYTDLPTPIYLGPNPSRGERTRGGMWTAEKLAGLEKQELDNALEWGNTEVLLTAMAGPMYFGRSTGASDAGPAYAWERELGETNGSTGNRFTTIPIVSWPVKGGGKVEVALHHSSKNTITTAFGHSWRMTYDVRVVPVLNMDEVETGANVYWGDGSVVPYTLSGSTYTAPAGVFDVLTRNADTSFQITKKDQSTWNTNTSGYLTSWKDRAGNTVNVARDGSNKITTITDAASRQVTVAYNGSNQVSSITDPTSRVWSFSYTGSDLTSITYPALGGSTYSRSFTYNTNHDILTETDLRGKVWTWTYDTNGGLTSSKTPLNHTTSYSYTSSSATMTLPGSQASTDNYSSGRISSRVDAGSFSESYTSYNTNNLPLSVTDKRGKVWEYTWDSRGNMLTKKNPLLKTWTFTYSTSNDLLTAKDPLNNQHTMTYHSSGKVLTVTDPLSRVIQTNTYDTAGQQLTTKNAMNEQSSFGYNTNGDRNSVTDPTSKTWTYGYDTLGRQTSVTNPLSKTTSTTYDDWGRPITVTYPGSVTKQTAYDRENNITSVTDELSHATTMAYDDTGRLTSVTNPKSEIESYAYNSNGWRTSVTNGRSYTRTYTFTSRGEVASLTMPDSAVEQWSYNGNGEVTAYTNPLSQVINYTFDDASRQTGIDYPAGTDVTFAYDDANRRTSMVDSTGTTSWTYNNGSEVTQLTSPQGTISYTYQNSGRRATMVETGVGTTTYGYDAAGRMTSVQNPFSETTAFTYDGSGRENKRTFHSGQYEERGYDDRDRLTSVTLKNSSHTTLRSQSYGYDNASNVTSHTVDGVQTTYGYDNADQLTSESRTGYSASYTYDANGNRATRTVNGSTETYTNDSGDKLTSISVGGSTTKSYGYDAAGRTTSVVVTGVGTTTLSYDYENRITQITYPSTATNTFAYNGLSARTQKVDSSGTRNYKRDGATVTSPVINDGAANYTPTLSERRSSTTTYLHAGLKNSDSQGGTAQTVGASRTYDAFGNVTGSTGTWSGPFGYGGLFGYQADADSGLMLLGHRYYDASTGRFLTRDRVHDGRNWYAYVSSSPLSGTDPAGTVRQQAISRVAPILDRVGGAIAGGVRTAGQRVGQGAQGVWTWMKGLFQRAPTPAPSITTQPPNNGFQGKPVDVVLRVGTKVQRFGDLEGVFGSPPGTPPPALSLPPHRMGLRPTFLNVTQDIPHVLEGPAAPAYGQPGGGVQWMFPNQFTQLIEAGFMEVLK